MKKLIIVGAGFAGLKLARKLKNHNFEIWLIDKNNYHQFPPLFYQVATAGLEPNAIAFPLRKIFQKRNNLHVRYTEVTAVDTQIRSIITPIGSFAYDYLVIATGTTSNFFNNKEIELNALPMKSVGEAVYLRNRLLENFEKALSVSLSERKKYLNVVIVGGGPTGVEVAGALSEWKNHILPKDYPEIDFRSMKIYLVESGPKLLASMSEIASIKAVKYLTKMGISVSTNAKVNSYNGEEVELSTGNKIDTKNLIWAAGVTGNLLGGFSSDKIVKGNRLIVNRYNQVQGYSDIFALGDIAYMETEKYPKGHPQLANVAIQQARTLAKNLIRKQEGRPAAQFEYKNKGSLATIGRNKAVVDLPFMKFQGFFAWLFWMSLHLMLILGIKNKLLIFVNWAWNYFTFDQSLRLIIKPYKKKYEQELTPLDRY